jgi:putative sterol carrier protein
MAVRTRPTGLLPLPRSAQCPAARLADGDRKGVELAKFLTTEWLNALTAALAAHDGFKGSIAAVELSLQFEVQDAPEGTLGTYHIDMHGGTATVLPGAAASPDATISSNYETAMALSEGQLNTQMAFMTGKIKVAGNIAKLITNQAMLSQYANASVAVEVEY